MRVRNWVQPFGDAATARRAKKTPFAKSGEKGVWEKASRVKETPVSEEQDIRPLLELTNQVDLAFQPSSILKVRNVSEPVGPYRPHTGCDSAGS